MKGSAIIRPIRIWELSIALVFPQFHLPSPFPSSFLKLSSSWEGLGKGGQKGTFSWLLPE